MIEDGRWMHEIVSRRQSGEEWNSFAAEVNAFNKGGKGGKSSSGKGVFAQVDSDSRSSLEGVRIRALREEEAREMEVAEEAKAAGM